ncbi:MAG TPA: pimeloyl-ACP methyl ester esterase BioH [Gallionellaceae bacterium]
MHIETQGAGEPLLLIHGWGMHGGLWGEMATQLAQSFTVHAVDLPGHGHSREMGDAFTLDAVVSALSAQFDEPLTLCGWSLGGMLAQQWALQQPQQVRRLILLASTPCFAAREDWAHGMATETLAQFAGELEQNFAATLRRFLALQVRGSEGERELLVALRERLFSRGEPQLAALRGGLDILRDADLRSMLPQIKQPVLALAGERDKLTPPQASHYLAATVPQGQVVEIAGAAHAPFLSHREQCVQALMNFMNC